MLLRNIHHLCSDIKKVDYKRIGIQNSINDVLSILCIHVIKTLKNKCWYPLVKFVNLTENRDLLVIFRITKRFSEITKV